jgi:hypothetical protein
MRRFLVGGCSGRSLSVDDGDESDLLSVDGPNGS